MVPTIRSVETGINEITDMWLRTQSCDWMMMVQGRVNWTGEKGSPQLNLYLSDFNFRKDSSSVHEVLLLWCSKHIMVWVTAQRIKFKSSLAKINFYRVAGAFPHVRMPSAGCACIVVVLHRFSWINTIVWTSSFGCFSWAQINGRDWCFTVCEIWPVAGAVRGLANALWFFISCRSASRAWFACFSLSMSSRSWVSFLCSNTSRAQNIWITTLAVLQHWCNLPEACLFQLAARACAQRDPLSWTWRLCWFAPWWTWMNISLHLILHKRHHSIL